MMNYQKQINMVLAGTIALVLLGCGGDGSSGDSASSSSSAAPTISTTRALPNQLITVIDGTISTGDVVDVEYRQLPTSASNSATAIIKAIATTDGEVNVAVPPYIDPNSGEFSAGEMSLKVKGRSIEPPLSVDDFLELGFETEGQITVGLLEYAIENYEQTLLNLNDLEVEMPAVGEIDSLRRHIEDEIERLEFMVDEIDIWGTLTVEVDNVITVLSAEQLNQLDAWNLQTLVSAQVELDAPFYGSAAIRAVGARRTILDAWEEAKRALESSTSASETTKQSIKNLFGKSMKDGIREGKRALNGGIALLGLFFSGAATASSGAAATVANAGGLAVATVSTWISAAQAWATGENTDASLQRDKDRFDGAGELLSQSARLGSQYVSAYGGGGKLAALGTMVNVGLSAKDLASAAGTSLCESLGSSSFCDSSAGENPVSTPTAFTIISYYNFNGSRGGDASSADIKISGNTQRPTFSWPGSATIAIVIKMGPSEIMVYGIQGTDSDNGDIPFGSSIRYGDYSRPNTFALGLTPSPYLEAGQSYVMQVGRSGSTQALIIFSVN